MADAMIGSLLALAAGTCENTTDTAPATHVFTEDLPVQPWSDIFPQWEYATQDARAYVRSIDRVNMPRSHVVRVQLFDYRCGEPSAGWRVPRWVAEVRLDQTHKRQSLRLVKPPQANDPYHTTVMQTNAAGQAVVRRAEAEARSQAERLCSWKDQSCAYTLRYENVAAAALERGEMQVNMLEQGPASLMLLAEASADREAVNAPVFAVHCENGTARGPRTHKTPRGFDDWAAHNGTHATGTRKYEQSLDSYVVLLTVRIYGNATDQHIDASLQREQYNSAVRQELLQAHWLQFARGDAGPFSGGAYYTAADGECVYMRPPLPERAAAFFPG